MIIPDMLDIGFKINRKKIRALDLPVEEISISELEHNLDIPYREREGTDDRNLTPREFIKNIEKEFHHAKVVKKVDINYPIELYFHRGKRTILDGVHRFTKIIMLGHKTIKIRRIHPEMINLIKDSDVKYKRMKGEITTKKQNKITLDNKPFKFTNSFLSCLVTGAEKSGASFFSICLISNLIQQGSKTIYFTAFSMAKEKLINQIGKEKVYEINKKSDLNNIQKNESIIVQSGNQKLFQQTIQNIKNLNEYIVFIKNIEEYDESILESIPKNQKIILSGNLDNCKFKDKILDKKRESKIIFTVPKDSDIKIPKLEKYESYLFNKKISGILRLEK